MSTLEEIERVVPTLTREEMDHLEATLRKLRRGTEASQPQGQTQAKKQTNLADFSGVLRLQNDPLDWQKAVRAEWE